MHLDQQVKEMKTLKYHEYNKYYTFEWAKGIQVPVGKLCVPRIRDKCINCLRTDCLLEKELIPITIRKSRKTSS